MEQTDKDIEKQLTEIQKLRIKANGEKETRRELVIRKFKEHYSREPTEEEIEKDCDYLHRCMVRLGKEN